MRLLSKAYGFFTHLHRELYRKNILHQVKLSKKVISVGNLSFGGTGKTPFTAKLIEDLQILNLKPAIVVKSYRGQTCKSALMDNEKSNAPEIWGDEACWYFKNLKIPIYAGPQKWQSAQLAAENQNVDVIVVDDGFQHHKLYKDLNILLFDALAGLEELRIRFREDLSRAQLADWLVITRANLAVPGKIEELKKALPSGKPLFLNQTLAQEIAGLGNRVGLVSGIANPDSFEKLFKSKFPQIQVRRLDFSDHHPYGLEDLKKIQNFKNEHELDDIVITEKDEVKLGVLEAVGISWKVFKIESQFSEPQLWQQTLRKLFL